MVKRFSKLQIVVEFEDFLPLFLSRFGQNMLATYLRMFIYVYAYINVHTEYMGVKMTSVLS